MKIGSERLRQFIRYLYEYDQGKRLRNVGFVKVEQDDEACVIHIHGKGFRMRGERQISIYLFYEEDGDCIGIWQGAVDNVNPAINYKLTYTREDTGTPDNFDRICGIILENDMRRRYAAVWDDHVVDVDKMRLWTKEMARPSMEEFIEAPGGALPEESAETSDDDIEESKEESTETSDDDIEGSEEELAEASGDDIEGSEEVSESSDAGMEEVSTEIYDADVEEHSDFNCIDDFSEPRRRCTKIQRGDLARLPRCEWKLANNSFLLHGCYNYHHLVFIEDGEHFWLGVPGIYHPREARAASAFGFSEFVKAEELDVALESEEYNAEETFGYWCRRVKPPMR